MGREKLISVNMNTYPDYVSICNGIGIKKKDLRD